MVVGEYTHGESYHSSTATSPGAVGYGTTPFGYIFTNPISHPSNLHGATPPRVRCDNAVPGLTYAGCVFPDIAPAMVYERKGPYPELADHIAQAQASGLPGAFPGGAPLNRLVDPVLQDRNGTVACPRSYPRPTGMSCDEYPFASSQQGAFTGGGAPRTWPGCGIALPGPGSSGPVGYSVCMINKEQNSNGGVALGQFYKRYRVISSDAFRVWIR